MKGLGFARAGRSGAGGAVAGQTFAAFGFPIGRTFAGRRCKLARCARSDMHRLVSPRTPARSALSTARPRPRPRQTLVVAAALWLHCRCGFVVVAASLSLRLRCRCGFVVVAAALSLRLRCRCGCVVVAAALWLWVDSGVVAPRFVWRHQTGRVGDGTPPGPPPAALQALPDDPANLRS